MFLFVAWWPVYRHQRTCSRAVAGFLCAVPKPETPAPKFASSFACSSGAADIRGDSVRTYSAPRLRHGGVLECQVLSGGVADSSKGPTPTYLTSQSVQCIAPPPEGPWAAMAPPRGSPKLPEKVQECNQGQQDCPICFQDSSTLLQECPGRPHNGQILPQE